jgi:predicted class III extradiol MEMO1 family dioxygenase
MITDAILHETAVEELKKTGLFKAMSNSVDEDEHSIEMHLPYTYKIFER